MSAALDPRTLLAILVGGGLGSVLRYVVTVGVTARAGPGFPWATFLINITGSLVIGIVAELVQTRAIAAPAFVRVFFMVGVLGGYTTFSTFSLDIVTLVVQDGTPMLGALYAIGSVALGTCAAIAGIAIVRAFV